MDIKIGDVFISSITGEKIEVKEIKEFDGRRSYFTESETNTAWYSESDMLLFDSSMKIDLTIAEVFDALKKFQRYMSKLSDDIENNCEHSISKASLVEKYILINGKYERILRQLRNMTITVEMY
jgi:hypothetical protein